MTFNLDIWQVGEPRSSSMVKGQSSRPEEENVPSSYGCTLPGK